MKHSRKPHLPVAITGHRARVGRRNGGPGRRARPPARVRLPPTPRHWPANSTTGRRTWRASASVAWWPRSPRSTTRTRSRRSPSSGRGPSHLAGSTTTCPTMTRRRWSGCSRARCPTGPTGLPWQSSPPPARRSSATTPSPRARPPSASGTARREPARQMANQLGMVFAKLDCKPRWRERLPELAMPALVVHGRRDPFFPVGNGEALAREIPGARLLVLERAATAIPDAVAGAVAAAMLALQALTVPAPTAGGRHRRAVRPLSGKGRA